MTIERANPRAAMPGHARSAHDGVAHAPDVALGNGGRRPPSERSIDSTAAILADPYRFIYRRAAAHGSDVFSCRVMLRPTLCLTGSDAARLVYDESLFRRSDAAPGRIQKTLFGVGGVQGLDDAAHVHRRRLFLRLTGPEQTSRLASLADRWWPAFAERWAEAPEVTLYRAAQEVLTRAVCGWAGVPLHESEEPQRVTELTALFDAAGAIGPRHWHARLQRKRADRWATGLIRAARDGRLDAEEDAPIRVVARHKDQQGRVLDERIAAVELLNLLRPTVATSVYIAFAAAALEREPRCRERIADGDEAYLRAFAEEVRRFSPFFPAIAAVTRRPFSWRGQRFPKDRRVLLDLYGINHDPRVWDGPAVFRPERFLDEPPSKCPFGFVPQGGGDRETGHRCPGEPFAVALIESAARFLARGVEYTVPPEDLETRMTRVPALPENGLRMRSVRLRSAPAEKPGGFPPIGEPALKSER